MGLDQYLYKQITTHYSHEIKANSQAFRDLFGIADGEFDDKSLVVKVDVDFGYWRKANAIHQWFVDNVQGERDDCGDYLVGIEQLTELRDLCAELLDVYEREPRGVFVLTAKDRLPPQSGFFFGSTEIDEYYVDNLRYTVDLLEDVGKDIVGPDRKYWVDYVYHSSW